VMENAGLCLDRFGLPYIPGSAVKGCARRMAIQNLLEAREAQEPTDGLARRLADIALVFGWGERDWSENTKDGKFVSDFAYAVSGTCWNEVSSQARSLLPKSNHFGGAVSFLPAFPQQLPAKDLELDVVTCHHPNYYGQPDKAKKPREWEAWNRKWATAPDIEEPNPVVFPSVAPGIAFQFAVLPLREERDALSQPGNKLQSISLDWLRHSLEIFGLGAKTTAGYGWFDASRGFNDLFAADLLQKAMAERSRLEDDRAAKQAKARDDAERAAKAQQRANLTPDEHWLSQFKNFNEGKRREFINKFAFDDEKWWPNEGELTDERIQFSLLHFLMALEPDFLAADRARTSSKIARALAALRRKFPSQAK